jgi:hypothetical protein
MWRTEKRRSHRLPYAISFSKPTAMKSSKTKIQIVLGGAIITFFHVGCAVDDEATNLLLLDQAKKMATEMEIGVAKNVNESYRPGSQNRVLFATKRASRLRKKKSHFIKTCSLL